MKREPRSAIVDSIHGEQAQRLLSSNHDVRDSLDDAFEMAELDDKSKSPPTYEDPLARDVDDASSLAKGDILGQESVDPVLNAKMHLVNNAIDEIGMTSYQCMDNAPCAMLNGCLV